MAKNTFELLLQRAEQRKSDKFQAFKFQSKAIGGEILVKKPSVSRFTEIFDGVEDEDSTRENMQANARLIYEACPVFKENLNELKEAFGVADPYDLIIAVFDANLGEFNQLALEITQMFGLGGELKN